NIRYFAQSNVIVGGLHAGTGKTSITAITGSILDAGDIFKDVIAGSLRMEAGTGIGELGSGTDNPLEISVGTNTVSARSGSGGINLLEDDDITVGDVSVSIDRVNADSTTTVETDEIQSDLVTSSGGSIVLRTINGSITINDGTAPEDNTGINAEGIGNVLLQAQGDTSDIVLNADVRSGAGNITLYASDSVSQNETADILTLGGTINVAAMADSVNMADNSKASTGDDILGNIRYFAQSNVIVGGLHAGLGKVSIIAIAGSILDGGDIFKDVIAGSLRMEAGTGIGELGSGTDNPLEISVGTNTVSARSGSGGINLLEDDDITVGDVIVVVGMVTADGTIVNITDDNQSDLMTSFNGSIVLRTLDGGIIINDGDAPENGTGITADGSGYILLVAGTYVDQNTDIMSTDGNITVVAESGGIDMADGTNTATTAPVIYTAHTDVNLSIIQSDGTVTVTATIGGIYDILETESANIIGEAAILTASEGIGLLWIEDIDTTVSNLKANSEVSGDIYIQETDGLIIDFVGIFGGNGWIVISTISGPLSYSEVDTSYSLGGRGHIYLFEAVGDWGDMNWTVLQNLLASRITKSEPSLSELGMVWITSPNPDDLFAWGQEVTRGTPILFLINLNHPSPQKALVLISQLTLGQFETPQLPESYSEPADIDYTIEAPKPEDEKELEGIEEGSAKMEDADILRDVPSETGVSLAQIELIRMERTISTLTAQQRVVLRACYAFLVRGNWKISATQAYEEYVKMSDSGQKRPLSMEHFLELIGYLNRRGLINIQINGQHPNAIDIMRSLPEEFIERFL
ncbi:hypothetical protein ACFLZG_04890, partial [Thermodesulfobacteriota bacterium]